MTATDLPTEHAPGDIPTKIDDLRRGDQVRDGAEPRLVINLVHDIRQWTRRAIRVVYEDGHESPWLNPDEIAYVIPPKPGDTTMPPRRKSPKRTRGRKRRT